MLSKPFAISELSDPSQVRVVLYSGYCIKKYNKVNSLYVFILFESP
ncbi:hypothetical protein MEI_00501 [Bartonella vinsonii subsp. arupensis Pm136co]|uniref:Uncharacterized protein n=1 Tax=Bartonella vinsonii subsp. arupensis Pm136co TaxID=1094561 RepID=A0ABP2QUC0_BARVI|nr:hypothetical protein MEI_00501 [Bartonella vinsonii subsp. arupensis Pm136co]